MDIYSIDDYDLKFSDDYKSLLAVDKSNNQTEKSFDLTDVDPPILVDVSEDDYRITRDLACANCMAFVLDPTGSGDVSFDGDKLGGLSIYDTRDIGKVEKDVDFFLDECGVNLIHLGSGADAFRIKTPDNENTCYQFA